MNDKLYSYFQNSFLKDYLLNDDITDISFNGKDMYYQSNKEGRIKANIQVSNSDIQDFVRQIANMSEKTFCITSPILDVSIGNYRLNAVHPSLTRYNYNKCLSFSIRKSKPGYNIDTIIKNLPIHYINYLKEAIRAKKTIIIGGNTGCGKTELQKYLISLIEENSRVIIIDNIQELSSVTFSKLDITFWQIDENNKHITLEEMIENSLRFNPDWTIITESRGKEMNSILNSLLTGHPLITTMHVKNLDLLPTRIMQMILQDDKAIKDPVTLNKEIYSSINIGIHLKRVVSDGKIIRYIDEIKEYYPDLTSKTIYKDDKFKEETYDI